MSVWQITEADVEALASGALLLGSGGGGEVWLAIPLLRQALREHGPVSVLDAAACPPDLQAIPIGGTGSATVLYEKPLEGGELVRAAREIELRTGVKADAIIGSQIGGLPALLSVIAAAQLGLPLIDADTAGRGSPSFTHSIMTVTGSDQTPMAFTNDRGASMVLNGVDTAGIDQVLYNALPALGGWAMTAGRPMSAREIADTLLLGSYRMACDLGRLMHGGDRAEAAARYGARTLFRGKVIEVQRRLFRQFPAGTAVIEHAERPERVMRIEMQSDYLLALEDGSPVACVPDLVCVLEHDTGACLTTERLRYGLWVEVLGIPCYPQWRSEAGLAVFGPRAFGYDLDYRPMDESTR